MEARERQAALDVETKRYYDERAHPLPTLKLGDLVRVQHATTKLWDRVGIVVGIGHNRDYRVRTCGGAVMWRNRRFLRIQRPPAPEASQSPDSASIGDSDPPADAGPAVVPKQSVGACPSESRAGPARRRTRRAPGSQVRRSSRPRKAPNILDL